MSSYSRLSDEEWLAALDAETREEADGKIALLTRFGADDPTAWVRSEIDENIPQTVRFLLLRRIRREIMDDYRFSQTPRALVSDVALKPLRQPDDFIEDGYAAFKKLLEKGADATDILRLARAAACEAVFSMIEIFDEGYEPELLDDKTAPRWAIMEIVQHEVTGRRADALHESILNVFEADR